ncbi:MAG: enoyl-CoA hydratase-related protein [Pararhodobacter sp.]
MNQPTRPLPGAMNGETPVQPPPLVKRTDHEGVAVLSLAGPDGNRMSGALVASLAGLLAETQTDPGVRAIVLTSARRDFCAGAFADLPPPGPGSMPVPPVLAALASLCAAVETSEKPVVCALSGRVAAGGLALALACASRVAGPQAVFVSPELRLGRLPAGAASVRLGWRIGAGPALALIGGTPLAVAEARKLGLIDAVDDAPVEAAVTRARALASKPPAPARPGLTDGATFARALAGARAALPQPLPPHRAAEAGVLDALEAAQLLPPDQALAFDLIRAQDIAVSPAARSLAHLARAARRAHDPAPPPVNGPVCLAMAPEAAARWAPVLLREGAQVLLLARDRGALAATLEAVSTAQFAQVRAGRLTQGEAATDWTRISGRLTVDALHPPAVVLADMAHLVWIEAMLPPAVPLAAWEPARPALKELQHRRRVVPLMPAPTRPARLCEVITRDKVPHQVLQTVTALTLLMRLTPLVAHQGPLLAPMIRAAAQAAARLRDAGVTEAELAALAILPPGLAAGGVTTDGVARAQPDLPLSAERLVLLAVVNAGLKLLADGRAARPSDLDLAMVMGAGWPNWRGGPMAEADGLGIMVLRHELRQAAALAADIWEPGPMLDEMIRRGWRLEDLNAG